MSAVEMLWIELVKDVVELTYGEIIEEVDKNETN